MTASDFDAKLAGAENSVAREKNEEIESLRMKLLGMEHLLGIELHANQYLRDEYAKLKPIVEAAKAWRRHDQNHGAEVTICRACHAKDVGFCDQHNMSYEVLLVLEGELTDAIDAASGKGQP